MQNNNNIANDSNTIPKDNFSVEKLNESWAGRRLIQALSHLPPINFSSSLNMTFQRKQLLEREQKKIALTSGDGPAERTLTKGPIGNGKVRQMFDDRRRGAGIDRSYPLKPITTTTTTTRNVDTNNSSSSSTSSAMKSIQNGKRTFNSIRRKSLNNSNNNNNNLNSSCTSSSSPNQLKKKSIAMTKSYGALTNSSAFAKQDFDDMDNLENETFPKEFSSMSLNNNRVGQNSQALGGDRNNNNNNSLERNALNGASGGGGIHKRVAAGNIKLKPLTKKLTNPAPSTTTKTIMRTPITSSGNRAASTPSRLSPLNSPKSYIPSSSGTSNKALLVSDPIMAMRQHPRGPHTEPELEDEIPRAVVWYVMDLIVCHFVLTIGTTLQADPVEEKPSAYERMGTCRYCQRHFKEDRLDKHEDVCKKMINSKRKIFNATVHRVKGTEAEVYLKKAEKAPRYGSAAAAHNMKMEPNAAVKKSNWRKKHEEFISAIREAKKVQAYLAKGGKLSDLPPPPPSENPDYIQCPHCSRRFNEAAAERHIPKCATMMHNKPRPGAQAAQRRLLLPLLVKAPGICLAASKRSLANRLRTASK
uniref:C2HC/C3H-type domain-containing protein n=1 Tax=Glossina palpalis gambiensis TaxID=67801 RepID=A0A1B0BPL9_9MUSC